MNDVLERLPVAAFPAWRVSTMGCRRPAVITDLLSGQALARITDMQCAREMLGAAKVSIGRNYVDAHRQNISRFVQGVRAPSTSKLGKTAGTFADYLDLVERAPDTRVMVSDQPTPPAVLQHVDLTALGIDTVVSGSETVLHDASTRTAYSFMFSAGRGNASDLHFDADGRDVILFQGYGRKRITMFEPGAAPRLHPIDLYSTVPLSAMDEPERHAFRAYAGGVEYVLVPGEAIFIPAFMWHHIEYLDSALSVNFRFAGVDDPDALAVLRTLHRDHNIANIVAGTLDPARAGVCRAAARRLRVASEQRYPSARAKYRALRALAEESYRDTLPPGTRPHPRNIVEAEDFLDGALCAYYRNQSDRAPLRRIVWSAQHSVRHAVRRFGRKLAHWA